MKKWTGELVMGQGWSIYDGPIGDGDAHRHSAIQICIAANGYINVDIEGTAVRTSGAVVIDSNVTHRLQSSTGPATLLYLDCGSLPGLWIRRALKRGRFYIPSPEAEPKTRSYAPADKRPASSKFVREILEQLWPSQDFTNYLDPIDTRVRFALSSIDGEHETPPDLNTLAEQLGLSGSRLRHLFTEQVGMSFSSYLLWSKLQSAFKNLSKDGTLTSAAHAGGFSDAAHMSRTFRRMFGISPTDLTRQGVVRLDTSSDRLFDRVPR